MTLFPNTLQMKYPKYVLSIIKCEYSIVLSLQVWFLKTKCILPITVLNITGFTTGELMLDKLLSLVLDNV